MARDTIIQDGHNFDSMEELYFYWWVKELIDNGYIEEFTSQPESFTLSDGLVAPYVKEMKRVENKLMSHTMIDSSIYTTDGLIKWKRKAYGLFTSDLNEVDLAMDGLMPLPTEKKFFDLLISQKFNCYIEVKPSFDQNNMTRLARTNIKWVWDKHQIFVNLIIPQKLFKKTFTPKRYLRTDKNTKNRVLKYKPLSLQEFVNKNENNQLSIM